jgi:GntR family transcriptional regulator
MNAVLPIYYQIKQIIKSWIINKEYGPGEKIPSENELAEKFKVSRLTVRQAFSQLVQEGFLNSKRGEGTFLTSNESLINSLGFEFSGFMDDLLYQVSTIKTKSAAISRIAISKLIREKLELSREDQEVVKITRIRLLREKLFTYTVNYLPLEIGMRIKEKDLFEKPLLKILVQDLNIQFTEAIQTIEASFANQEVAGNLDIPSGSPILYVERTMYTQKHKPIELFQSSYRGDLYKFIVRFKNVKRKDGSRWIHHTDEEIC